MNDKHYNPAIAVRLRTIVDGRQWSVLLDYLSGLSNAQFRTAGYMLGEKFMPMLGYEDFWQLAEILVQSNSKAFLVTVLKSWVSRNEPFVPSVHSCAAFFLSLQGRDEDVRKTLTIMLPTLTTPDQVEWLISALGCNDPHRRIAAFITTTTPVTSFLLMHALHEIEDDRPLLVRTAYYLIKKGDGLSFNLASLICACFGLDEVKGTFSLNIRPYEISRLMSDFSAFSKAIKS